eukprot:1139885-Pelagomonas_calceolata.AAC.4
MHILTNIIFQSSYPYSEPFCLHPIFSPCARGSVLTAYMVQIGADLKREELLGYVGVNLSLLPVQAAPSVQSACAAAQRSFVKDPIAERSTQMFKYVSIVGIRSKELLSAEEDLKY